MKHTKSTFACAAGLALMTINCGILRAETAAPSRGKQAIAVSQKAAITDFSAGPYTRQLWKRVAPIIKETEDLPFLDQLAKGTLDPLAFTNYILQDDYYLGQFARAKMILASKAPNSTEAKFWANAAISAIGAEEGMHAALLADKLLVPSRKKLLGKSTQITPSPTTLGYTSYLTATISTDSYGAGVASVLPCSWVYAHIGKVLIRKAGKLSPNHPYKTWIDAYDSPIYDAKVRQSIAILEEQLAAANPAEREHMSQVFTQACIYELHFWGTAHYLQDWKLAQAN